MKWMKFSTIVSNWTRNTIKRKTCIILLTSLFLIFFCFSLLILQFLATEYCVQKNSLCIPSHFKFLSLFISLLSSIVLRFETLFFFWFTRAFTFIELWWTTAWSIYSNIFFINFFVFCLFLFNNLYYFQYFFCFTFFRWIY